MQPVPHSPGPYTAVKGSSQATTGHQCISAASPRAHCPHGKRGQLLHIEKAHCCLALLFPWSHSGAPGLQLVSISVCPWSLTSCGSEHSCEALHREPLPSHSPASHNRPEHTQQSKQGFHHTPDKRDKHHICLLVTDTDGKIPSSSCVSWLLHILTKEEKIRQLQHECSLDPVYHCLLAMQHQHNSHMNIFATENIRK